MDTPHNTELSEAVLRHITEASIEPRPRWHFLAREYAVWGTGVVAVVVGAAAVAAILFELRFASWDIYRATHETMLDFTLDALPYVWLVCFGAFAAVLYVSVRNTKCGYRYRAPSLLLVSVALSGVFGGSLYIVGFGRFADENIGVYMPLHVPLKDREHARWMQIEEGRLAGVIRSVPPVEEYLWVEDIEGKAHPIDMRAFMPADIQMLRSGDHVRVIGIPLDVDTAVLFGCIVVQKHDDVLRFDFDVPGRGRARSDENKILLARSTECEGVRSYERLAPGHP